MNRDDIIDWVAQVDMAFLKRIEPWNMFDKYEAFAKLVAEHERKACAKLCDKLEQQVCNMWHGQACAGCAVTIRARGEA